MPRRTRSESRCNERATTAPPRHAAPVLLREDVGRRRGARRSTGRDARNSLSEGDARGADRDAARRSPTTSACASVVLAANGPALLRRPRPQGDDRAAQRCRWRPRLFQAADGSRCSAMMQAIVHLPQPVIAAVQGRGDRGRLPAGRELRSRGRVERGEIRHARRQYRAVLLDADGGAVAQRRRASTRWKCC